jgi:hypothetical protein
VNSERLWILILTLAAFAAGLAAGVLVGRETATLEAEAPFAPYMERLVRDFDLDPEQKRNLRVALVEYDQTIERLRDRVLSTQQFELIRAGEDCFYKIREYIIPIDRRSEFDRLLGGPPGAVPQ